MPIRPNMLETSASSPSRSGKVRFSVAIWFPAGFDKVTGNHFKVPDRGTCRITWSTSSTLNADGESRHEPTDYFSMLPSGNIPRNGLDFFAQFLSHLREVWLETCDLAERHLAECVSEPPTSTISHQSVSIMSNLIYSASVNSKKEAVTVSSY